MHLSRSSIARARFVSPILALIFAFIGGAAEPPKRLNHSIDTSRRFQLSGHLIPLVESNGAVDQGSIPTRHMMPPMALHFSPTAEQTRALNLLLQAQQDKNSPQYHKFLTPEDFCRSLRG